jgi:hypothetical protein
MFHLPASKRKLSDIGVKPAPHALKSAGAGGDMAERKIEVDLSMLN